ncbi:integrase arm-type DNA-binding domain-containing protein [Salipiger pacificus]|nr:integrase arm-type DNA-binding domain-containing protein [Alloyangia pacifica]
MKLTEAAVRNLPLPSTGSTRIKDDKQRGLAVVLSAGGSRSFVLRYSQHGKQRQKRIGQWPEMTLAQARDRAAAMLLALSTGRPIQTGQTMADAFEDYWKSRKLTLARPQNDLRQWQMHLAPQIGTIPISEFRTSDVRELWSKWTRKGLSARTPSRVLGHFIRTLEDDGVLAQGTMPRGAPSAPQRRDRTPTLDEMRRVWRWAQTDKRPSLWRWLILTGARRREVSELRWDELDLDLMVWTCPAVRMKARRQQRWAIIEPMLPLPRRRSDWVWSNRAGTGPLSNELSVLIKRSGVDLAPHDLRRGLAVAWAEHLGVDDATIGLQLAHTPSSITGTTYQRSDRLEQRRELMARWFELLERPVT